MAEGTQEARASDGSVARRQALTDRIRCLLTLIGNRFRWLTLCLLFVMRPSTVGDLSYLDDPSQSTVHDRSEDKGAAAGRSGHN